MTTPMKRNVRVTIIKELELEFTPELFCDLTVDEYLAEFSRGLWPVESIEDVFKYAAAMVALYGAGGGHDGLGLVQSDNYVGSKKPDVIFKEIDEEVEVEILEHDLLDDEAIDDNDD